MNEAGFRAALLDPGLPVPKGLTDPAGAPAGRRFSVYRNNVAVGLTEALGTGFPVTRRLLGAEFFDAMAGVFLRAHPPASPVLMFWGEDLPAFLAAFPPVAHLGYLPDVARLELAIRQSYHAADAGPVAAAALAALTPDRLSRVCIRLAPSARLVRSAWPIHAIWSANVSGAAPPSDMRAESVLVARPAFDPLPLLLPEGTDTVVARLMAGETFGAASASAPIDADFGALLGLIFGAGVVTSLSEGECP
jgi:hypothetical protein